MVADMPSHLSLVTAVPRPRRGLARFAAVELGIWAVVYGTYLAVRGRGTAVTRER